jgi:hypothetical protein
MNNLGYTQAIALQTALMPIAYLLCTLGLLLSVFRHWGNFHEILMTIVGILVIVVMANGYPTALTTVADGFKQLRQQTTEATPQQSWQSIFSVGFESPAWDQVAEKIALMLCQMFKWIGKISIWFLDWVQSWAFNGLIAISPVLIGALAVPWTQGVGINFLITSFGVAAWHLGIALVDILLASAATQIFTAAGFTGGVGTATTISLGALPIFLGALAAIVLVALALYLAVPIIIGTVLKGGSPLTTGAKAGMEMALTGFGMGSMAANRIAAQRAAASSGGSSEADQTLKQALAEFLRSRKGGRDGGDEGGGGFAKPSPHVPGGDGGGSTLDVVTRKAEESTTSPSGTSSAPAPATPAGRQSAILTSYEDPSESRRHRRSDNELERRQDRAMRTLGDLDKDYT